MLQQPQVGEISGAERPLSPEPQRVLVVESDEGARAVLAATLKAAGLGVLEAGTGEAALKLVREEAPDLAIVSTELGEEDGIVLVAQIRGENPERILPVVLLAKDDEPALQQLSKVVDADEVLLKPALPKEVAAVAVMQLSERTLDGTVKLDASQAPPNQLLRALLNGDRSGVFELCGGRAHVAFRKGQVIDAQVDRHHGPDALVKALALHAGPYRVAFRPVQFAPAFQLGPKEVLQQIEPRLRAFSELSAHSVELESRLEIEFAALAKALPSLPDAANAVVRLFDGLRTVRQVVLDSPVDELLTLQVAQRLLALSIIKVAEDHARPSAGVLLFGDRRDDADKKMAELFSAPIQVAAEQKEGENGDWADVLIKAEPLSETEGDPAAGWVAGKLEPELAKQLEAFDIKSVDEAPLRPAEPLSPAVQELKDFAAPIPLTEAVKPAAPAAPEVTPIEAASIDALESGFFEHPSQANKLPDPARTPPSAKAGSSGISAAALKAVTTTQTMGAVTPEPKRSPGMMIAALLLVVAVAVVAAMFAQRDSSDVKPPPAVEVAPAPPTPPEPAPVVVKVEKPATQEAIDAAAKLYEDGKLPEAIKALEQIVDDDPSSVPALLLLSEVKIDWGDLSGAGEAANNVLALEPKNARAHLLIATIHITQWKKETDPESKAKFRKMADEEIQKALDDDPNGKFADEARALLKR